jgi:hypothetical protein
MAQRRGITKKRLQGYLDSHENLVMELEASGKKSSVTTDDFHTAITLLKWDNALIRRLLHQLR